MRSSGTDRVMVVSATGSAPPGDFVAGGSDLLPLLLLAGAGRPFPSSEGMPKLAVKGEL